MIPGILFAAASSGCGKTTITCGALRAWQRKGLKIKAWIGLHKGRQDKDKPQVS